MIPISAPQEIIDRLKKAINVTSDSDLARLIGVSQQAVSSARKGKVPEAWARVALSRFGISADWLYTGSGAMLFTREEFTGTSSPRSTPRRPEESIDKTNRLLAERDTRIRELESQLEDARNAERRALLEANAALKRLLQSPDADSPGGF